MNSFADLLQVLVLQAQQTLCEDLCEFLQHF